ncbi:MAG TPA: hypothetical protein VFM29_02520 [Vicinamibacteria bacterium]|nr:hypothetical protein [Vicinamibacteria bacterium]
MFRGEFNARVPIASIRSASVREGTLVLDYPGGPLELDLGHAAARWAARIREPRGLAEKLGLKPGLRVSVVGLDDERLREEVRLSGAEMVGPRAREVDLVFVGLQSKADLRRLTSARGRIRKAGAVWAVWPKGRKDLREDDVRAFNPTSGLVDVKVVSVSPVLSGLKLMIPRKDR